MKIKYDNRWYLDVIIVILFIFVLFFSYYAYNFMKSDSNKCMQQPFIYGAGKMGNIACNCYQYGRGFPIPFNFNDTAFVTPEVKNPIGINPNSLTFNSTLANITNQNG